jgi:hypothetical protein
VYADERNTKQNSVTTTFFTGAFEEDKTRREFISLISINLVKFSFKTNAMKILTTGYIGKRLYLFNRQGHHSLLHKR